MQEWLDIQLDGVRANQGVAGILSHRLMSSEYVVIESLQQNRVTLVGDVYLWRLVRQDTCCQGPTEKREEAFDIVTPVKEFQRDMNNGTILPGGPGIVVLSHVLEVLHMNRQAVKLASLLGPPRPAGQLPNNAMRILPPPLTDLAGKILSMLQSRHERGEQGQIEIRHSANESDRPVHIRGVGVPDRHGVAQARIVLIITEARTSHSENEDSNGSMV